MLGNIYSANDDFGMGVKILNTTDKTQILTVSYKILDSEGNIVFEEKLGEKTILSKGNENVYIIEPTNFGTYTLL